MSHLVQGRKRDGRYDKTVKCDCCGRSVLDGEHQTDERVCGSSDGPGFFLCTREPCVARRERVEAKGGLEALRALYAARRAKTGAKPTIEDYASEIDASRSRGVLR